MQTVDNPSEFRSNIKEYLNKLVGNEKIVDNIEKGVYNYSIQEATYRKLIKKWCNPYFVMLYKDRLRTVFVNMKSTDLIDRIKKKEIKPHKIAFMTHQEISPVRWDKLIELKKLHEDNLYSPKIDANTDDFTCRKCKSKKCSYYQIRRHKYINPWSLNANQHNKLFWRLR